MLMVMLTASGLRCPLSALRSCRSRASADVQRLNSPHCCRPADWSRSHRPLSPHRCHSTIMVAASATITAWKSGGLSTSLAVSVLPPPACRRAALSTLLASATEPAVVPEIAAGSLTSWFPRCQPPCPSLVVIQKVDFRPAPCSSDLSPMIAVVLNRQGCQSTVADVLAVAPGYAPLRPDEIKPVFQPSSSRSPPVRALHCPPEPVAPDLN